MQIQGRPRHPATALAVAPERLLATSHSVEWDDVRVRTGGATLSATVVGRDPASDLVLLQAPGLAAPPLDLAGRAAATGELALVVGRTWGGHLTSRLVSVTRLDGPIRLGRGRSVDDVLSLGLAPYTGFSGSAVVGADGHVLGISTTGLLRGAGMALPAGAVRGTIEALGRDGRIRRGFLGISSQPVSVPPAQRPAEGADAGLLVVSVAPETPAAAAGLLVGDILMEFDSAAVNDPEQLLSRLSAERIGRPVPVGVIRGRDVLTLTVTVGERPGV